MLTPSDALLARYLAGDCHPVEARDVERWLAADPANTARFRELHAIWEARHPPIVPDIDAMWAGVRRTMDADRARSARHVRAFRIAERRRWWSPSMAVAAAVVLAVGGGLVASFVADREAALDAGESMHEYVTPRGQRATFQLADGTRLMLAAGSRLRVPARYGRNSRDVYLEGEAMFDVVRDAARPFRVRAKHAVVQVLGTAFDVRAYAGDSTVAVAVTEGVVALGSADTPRSSTTHRAEPNPEDIAPGVVLRAGEVGTLDDAGRVTTARGADAAAYLAWTEGRLLFVETPLPEVVRVVGRWYDIDIRLEGRGLATRVVTAEFGTASVDDVLGALALAVDARVVRQGKIVTLHRK